MYLLRSGAIEGVSRLVSSLGGNPMALIPAADKYL
jgi:hypothetical protein